jgi:EAL domain-containing protein (putative c-di-GMP-specific phosphodiesterase class I)
MSQACKETLASRLATLPSQWVAGFPLTVDESGVVAHFFKCELRSTFRPFELGTATIVRAELAVRGPDGEAFPPEKLFSLAAGADGLLKLDRLCRLAHALNHFVVASRREPLLLNIHPRLFDYVKTAHGRTFARMLSHFDLSPGLVVLEVPPGQPQATLDGYLGEGFAVRVAQE